MSIDILCKVVDNYGDIGVVYRLAKALSDRDPDLRLRLLVDRLDAFRSLCPEVDPSLPLQPLRHWTLVRWEAPGDAALALFRAERPRVVLECFACGRPDWYEDLLFDPEDSQPRTVINIEHLSAETWVPDFHLLRSATRSALVRKWMFMPGFSDGTGGLIIDEGFRAARARWLALDTAPDSRAVARRAVAATSGLDLKPGHEGRFWFLAFSYARDYTRVVADLAVFNAERPLLALVAAGLSAPCFLSAWEAAGRPFPVLALPFLPQETWDELLLAADFSIVRGEESQTRAALSGTPFLWQAYLQAEGHQRVKVSAFLDCLAPFFAGPQAHANSTHQAANPSRADDFVSLSTLYEAFNARIADGPETRGDEALLPVLRRAAALRPGFRSFGDSLMQRGDLAAHLMTFLGEVG